MSSSKKLRFTRDGVLFVVGLAGIAHETVVMNAERPSLLVLFAGMVGLPAFIRKDERGKTEDTKEEVKQ